MRLISLLIAGLLACTQVSAAPIFQRSPLDLIARADHGPSLQHVSPDKLAKPNDTRHEKAHGASNGNFPPNHDVSVPQKAILRRRPAINRGKKPDFPPSKFSVPSEEELPKGGVVKRLKALFHFGKKQK